jgi:histidinol-phosphatase (PHP family)
VTKIRSSPHNHTRFVDGKNTAAEMARAAFQKGFVSLGFSEHAPQDFDRQYCMSEADEPRYRAEVLALREAYAGRMKIWLGIERDRYAQVGALHLYDYVIGAQHYLPLEGDYVAVDGEARGVRALIDRAYGGDAYRMTADYFGACAACAEAYRPEIVAHIDLIRKQNLRHGFFDESDPRYQAPALEALERIAATGALLEINTGAIARGYLKDPYPAPFLLKRWRELGGRSIISGDCHDARFIDHAFDRCVELMLDAGFREAWRLGTGDELFVPVPLSR